MNELAEYRRRIAERYRERAAKLERFAQTLRDEGDPLGAEDVEAAAVDYIEAAEEFELAA